MIRSELILALSRRFRQLSQGDVAKSIDVILEGIGDGLANDHRTEIRGFGSFSQRTRKGRIGRNPKTGEPVEIETKAKVHFKLSRDITDHMNSFQETSDQVKHKIAA